MPVPDPPPPGLTQRRCSCILVALILISVTVAVTGCERAPPGERDDDDSAADGATTGPLVILAPTANATITIGSTVTIRWRVEPNGSGNATESSTTTDDADAMPADCFSIFARVEVWLDARPLASFDPTGNTTGGDPAPNTGPPTLAEDGRSWTWDWTWNTSTAQDGYHQLRVIGYDRDGGTTEAVVPIVLVADPLPLYGYTVLARSPHDRTAFTQGLVWDNGSLYESTGRYGESRLRMVDPASGTVLREHELGADYFGEGLALLDGRLYQLTWKAQTAFVYDRATFEERSTFSYTTEGWGLTTVDDRLVMSDGSATLRFIDPTTFTVTRSVTVTANGVPVTDLNELEYVADDGVIYANVWYDDRIAMIEPHTGVVLGWVDLATLTAELDDTQGINVLNGIAYDEQNGTLLVTGKLWPNLFAITVV